MRQIVGIKSYQNGIHVILDPDVDFEELYVSYAEKFRDSARFFGNAKIVISFEGRKLSDLEERALVEAISEYTDLTVLCVMEEDEAKEQVYIRAAQSFLPSGTDEDGKIDGTVYKGTLHAGQNLENKGSIIILGDVNAGASVTVTGSVVVLGTIYGKVWAGSGGDEGCFVVAQDFKTDAVRICELECRIFAKSAGFLRKTVGTRIVYIDRDDNEIVCDELSKEFLADIPF